MNLMKIAVPLMITSMAFGASTNPLYVKNCQTCHGPLGEKTAIGKSKPIKDMSAVEIEKALTDLSVGTRKSLPVAKSFKKKFLDTHTKEEVRALAEYISAL